MPHEKGGFYFYGCRLCAVFKHTVNLGVNAFLKFIGGYAVTGNYSFGKRKK